MLLISLGMSVVDQQCRERRGFGSCSSYEVIARIGGPYSDVVICDIWVSVVYTEAINSKNGGQHTSTFASLPGDLAEDETVRDNDDDERREVDGDDVEEVVGELVAPRREEVEGDALREPLEHRVFLHVKDDALQGAHKRCNDSDVVT